MKLYMENDRNALDKLLLKNEGENRKCKKKRGAKDFRQK